MSTQQTRRDFLETLGLAAIAGGLAPDLQARPLTSEAAYRSPLERPRFGSIGLGGMGRGDARAASRFGDLVAVCDVDAQHAEQAKNDPNLGKGRADVYRDYRKLLDRKDIDFVTISTPDHWHTRIAIAALKAGKDVYCQKPLTLTIDEGKLLRQVVKDSGRVFQVGTQQRSENRNMFLTAVAMVRAGRIGKVKRVTCAIGGAPRSAGFAASTPPQHLDWDMWLGQTPRVDYIRERCHNNFRWWYEYSGGKLTDWGAHHVDIAQWAIGMEDSGPKTVEVLVGEHPVPFEKGNPTQHDRYNTATKFQVACQFPGGIELLVRDDTQNGVQFEGDKGSFFVSRGSLTGEPVTALVKDPIVLETLVALRKGKKLDSHMGNFIACCADRSTPVSDVPSHHRVLTTCHLANIALRLSRKLTWNAATEQIVGDDEANAMQKRVQRKGYEVEV